MPSSWKLPRPWCVCARPTLALVVALTASPGMAQQSVPAATESPAAAADVAAPPAAATVPVVKKDDDAFLRGMQAKSKNQVPLAIKEFTQAAASGHADAQHLLASCTCAVMA